MTLTHIALFSLSALLYVLLLPARWRGWALMIGSVIAIYWLQPATPAQWLDFSLPTALIVIAILNWLLAGKPASDENPDRLKRLIPPREDMRALIMILALILIVAATRFLPAEFQITSRPPEISGVLLGLVVTLGFGGIFAQLWKTRRWFFSLSILLILFIFVLTKNEALATWVSRVLRSASGQDIALASALDLEWLGFSYVAFRLIHTIRDRQTGILPELSLREYMTYVVFFPSFTAGPIDRAERFSKDFHALTGMVGLNADRIVEGGRRISIGLFKKFVVADSLALIALNGTNAFQAQSVVDLWILLYAYAFRLYLDFSGYTDIAIGIGILFGITLPENFDRPYLKNNIQSFWQSWHMTLSNWARFYIFSPLSRWLLTRKKRPATPLIMFCGHMSVMIVIGLWHGIAASFFVWGIWHGLGLFIHKMWTDRTRKWYIGLRDRPLTKRLWTIAGVALTFHFVLLGWVWFALSDFEMALSVLVRLFGGDS